MDPTALPALRRNVQKLSELTSRSWNEPSEEEQRRIDARLRLLRDVLTFVQNTSSASLTPTSVRMPKSRLFPKGGLLIVSMWRLEFFDGENYVPFGIDQNGNLYRARRANEDIGDFAFVWWGDLSLCREDVLRAMSRRLGLRWIDADLASNTNAGY